MTKTVPLKRRIFFTRIDQWMFWYLNNLVWIFCLLGIASLLIGLINQKPVPIFFGSALLSISLALQLFEKSNARKKLSQISIAFKERVKGPEGLAYYFLNDTNFLTEHLGYLGFTGLTQYIKVLNFVLFSGPIYLQLKKQIREYRDQKQSSKSLIGTARFNRKFSFSGRTVRFNKLKLQVYEDASLDEFQCKWMLKLFPKPQNPLSHPTLWYQNSSILSRLRGTPKNIELWLKVSKRTFSMISNHSNEGKKIGLLLYTDDTVKYFENFLSFKSTHIRIDWSLDKTHFDYLPSSWSNAEIKEIAAPAHDITQKSLSASFIIFENY